MRGAYSTSLIYVNRHVRRHDVRHHDMTYDFKTCRKFFARKGDDKIKCRMTISVRRKWRARKITKNRLTIYCRPLFRTNCHLTNFISSDLSISTISNVSLSVWSMLVFFCVSHKFLLLTFRLLIIVGSYLRLICLYRIFAIICWTQTLCK